MEQGKARAVMVGVTDEKGKQKEVEKKEECAGEDNEKVFVAVAL